MKAQIVLSQDLCGKHNSNLDQTRMRLLKGASWKKQRTVVIVPAGALVPAKAAFSWWNLMFPPNQPVVKALAQGLEVGQAYSDTIEGILADPELSKWEYILTLEHDNLPPSDGVVKLMAQMEAHPELSCIGGLYFTKGEGGVAQIWGDPSDPIVNFRPQVPIPGQLVECVGTGQGFNLFRMSMFKDSRLRRPWFKTLDGRNGNGLGTQDLYFWSDARKYGYRCAIDCSVLVGHIDVDTDTVW